MNTYHRLFTPLEHVPLSSCFAGGNSAIGYRALPETQLDETKLEKLYILKGGPGTGKSTLMKKIAKGAENRHLAVTYYYCASDPDSLDGIVISGGGKQLGMLDGTPPHAKEATLPGVSGEYVNLGAFWNSAKLEAKRNEIAALAREKSDLFATSARFLEAAELLDREIEKRIYPILLEDKMQQAIQRLLHRFPAGNEKLSPEKILLHAHTMKGSVYLAPPVNAVATRCILLESSDTSRFYLRRFSEALATRGIRTQVLVSPIRHDVPLGLILPEYSVSFTIASEKAKTAEFIVNMARFTDKAALLSLRSDYRTLTLRRKEMIHSADVTLQKASQAHFALESMYASAMDFEKLSHLTDHLDNEIFSRFET